jgi:hypothetical protein
LSPANTNRSILPTTTRFGGRNNAARPNLMRLAHKPHIGSHAQETGWYPLKRVL